MWKTTPETPAEVDTKMRDWLDHAQWGRPAMAWTAERFLREYYAAVEVLGQDPVPAYATAHRALFPTDGPFTGETDADA